MVVESFLSPEELDIAAKLQSFQRKIASMRVAGGELRSVAEGECLQTPVKRRRAPSAGRSPAEDYRRNRSIQKLMQGLAVLQAALTFLLALVSHVGFLLSLVGVSE